MFTICFIFTSQRLPAMVTIPATDKADRAGLHPAKARIRFAPTEGKTSLSNCS